MDRDSDQKKGKRIKTFLILIGVAYFSVGAYLVASRMVNAFGFPLDDAWIHHCFARNFYYFGEWAFQHGFPTAGSTSPLWSVLLTPSFLFKLNPILWSFFLNGFLLSVLGFLGQLIYDRLSFSPGSKFPWIGILLITEWHMIWAAGSGMEIILFSLLCIVVFFLLTRSKQNYWIIGSLVGVLLWVRPEGITLIGPILFILITQKLSRKEKVINLCKVIGMVMIFLLFYMLFNHSLSGKLFSNTFFAKQAEYEILLRSSILVRYLRLLLLPLIGTGVLLVPGFLYIIYEAICKREWRKIAFVLWILGFIFVYAFLLPVDYQHGRYVMPVIPIFFVLSVLGVRLIISKSKSRFARIINKSWLISISIIVISFFILGAISFSNDVGLINSEMVDTAKWLKSNIRSNAIIAAHDIGALGYFTDQRIVDLAGLVSPEVISFIRDEKRISTYMDLMKVNYLVTFPDWYPELTKLRQVIYKSKGIFSTKLGGTNMEVLLWNSE